MKTDCMDGNGYDEDRLDCMDGNGYDEDRLHGR